MAYLKEMGRRRRRVVIVAHADDETLWGAGIMLRYPGDWLVICCSIPYRDAVRAYKFYAACEVLGARGRVLPWVEKRNEPLEHLDTLDLDGFDIIVTHGAAGEYGHPAHIGVHAHIAARWPDKMLCFGYRLDGGEGSYILDLCDAEWDRKLAALRCYDNPMMWRGSEVPTWEALLGDYGPKFNLRRESYDDNC